MNRIHIQTEDLCVHRDTRCLVSHLRVEIPQGAFVAVVGPSGVGKSSLLSCLAGQIAPAQGRVLYRAEGDTLMGPEEFQRQIGMVFQNFRLSPNTTVLTNVLCGTLGAYPWWRTLLGFPTEEKTARANCSGNSAPPSGS
ncbi:ATP-binding cassette domain-containing protein [Oscillatoria amoena NRMC-F 0135]|nr:ATP-binding cassette domain-containing protein [Oscillatoria amoena NRMC-F 0135]